MANPVFATEQSQTKTKTYLRHLSNSWAWFQNSPQMRDTKSIKSKILETYKWKSPTEAFNMESRGYIDFGWNLMCSEQDYYKQIFSKSHIPNK